MNRYLYALERVIPEDYAGVFAEDGQLIVREALAADDYIETGREEIQAYAVNLRESWDMGPVAGDGPEFGPIRHVYYNFRVEVIGDSASGETYWTTRSRNDAGGPAVIASMGRSEDHYVKIDGQWFFDKRIIIVDMDTPLPD